MEVVSDYAVGIGRAGRKTFGETERVYRDAVPLLIGVYDLELPALSAISVKTGRSHAAEHLVHMTKKNIARYNFDVKFIDFPAGKDSVRVCQEGT